MAVAKKEVMAICEFTEFSYGYALTYSLSKIFASVLPKAPFFPSLVQEGSSGGGYDVKLPLVPIPLFLQFKIPTVLKRASSLKPSAYSVPYYRIYLRTRSPNQHKLLLELEDSEPFVFYATPLFHEITNLDRHFVTCSLHDHSLFIKPSKIGRLDNKVHHLSYQAGVYTYWLRSEPKAIEGRLDFKELVHHIEERRILVRKELQLENRHITADEMLSRQREALTRLRDWLLNHTDVGFGKTAIDDVSQHGEPRDMARKIAYYFQVRLGLTLILFDAATQPD